MNLSSLSRFLTFLALMSHALFFFKLNLQNFSIFTSLYYSHVQSKQYLVTRLSMSEALGSDATNLTPLTFLLMYVESSACHLSAESNNQNPQGPSPSGFLKREIRD